MTRSNRLLIAGGVVTLLGAALVLVVLLGQQSAPATDAASGDVPTTATEGAVVTPVVQPAVDEDGNPVFTIPEGLEALALTVEFQRSVAGLPAVGDRVNIYGVFETYPGDLVGDLPAVRRVLADVPVLAVTGAEHRTNTGAPTVVVGLSPADVETAIYVHTAESLYLTLVAGQTEASPETDGANAGTLRP